MGYGTPLLRWLYNHSPHYVRDQMATLYSRRRSKVKFGPKFEEYLADLERTQWYSNDRLRELQEEKIRRLFWQAGRFVPHYKALFARLGISASSVHGRDDLNKLPVLQKSQIQRNTAEFRSQLYCNPRDVEIISTSGTTGKALEIAVESGYFKLEKAFLWLQRIGCGVKVGDRTAYFSGFPVIPTQQKRPPFWVYDGSENRMLFSVEHMSRQNLEAYTEELIRFNPLLIVGYTNAISVIAAYLCNAGINSVRPRGIFTSSGTLLPQQRLAMEKAFGCRVMDLYGQAEYCGMIIQCDRGNYHIKDEYGVVEILNRDGIPAEPGEIGEIVSTGLNNMAMPFIRYGTGDTAVPKAGTCACGRGGALVERIVGRLDDVVVTPEGRFICDVMDFAFYVPHIEEAQVIQETRDLLRVRTVPGPAFCDADKAQLLSNLRERVGPKMRVQLELVDQIPRLPNGKFRFVISKVPLELGMGQQPGELAGVETGEVNSL